MATLNKAASELMVEFEAHACTDVTGFGLVGHLAAMASASKVDVEIVWDDVPLLPGVLECLADDIIPGATERNRESSGDCVAAEGNVEPAMLDVCFDAQTSGGLLIAVSESRANDLLARLRESGASESAIIGAVRGPGSGRVFVRTEGRRQIPPKSQTAKGAAPVFRQHVGADSCCTSEEASDMSCCEGNHPSTENASDAGRAGDIEARFHEVLKASVAPGALDERTKRVIAIALSVLAKCEPCIKSHIKKAREMGVTQEEIDEAAWMAVSFGGCPTMMFYKGVRRS
jgi:AhpD family alkylhydroperoxidase